MAARTTRSKIDETLHEWTQTVKCPRCGAYYRPVDNLGSWQCFAEVLYGTRIIYIGQDHMPPVDEYMDVIDTRFDRRSLDKVLQAQTTTPTPLTSITAAPQISNSGVATAEFFIVHRIDRRTERYLQAMRLLASPPIPALTPHRIMHTPDGRRIVTMVKT